MKEPVIFITENEKLGFKNPDTNEIVIEPKYDYAEDFVDGLAAVELDGKWGLIDETEKEVVPIIYDLFWGHIEVIDGFVVAKLNGKWGIVDINSGGKFVPFLYDEIDIIHFWYISVVKLNGKYGFIDRTGKVVVPIIYDSVEYFSIYKDLRTKLNGKWCSIDKTNKVVEIKNEKEILELEQFISEEENENCEKNTRYIPEDDIDDVDF